MRFKKSLKKICGILIAGALIVSCTSGMAASEVSLDNAVFELSSLGIFTGDENGKLRLEDNMTRAEFAKIVTVLTGNDEIADSFSGSIQMTDVPEDYWAAKYIGSCIDLDFMTGDGDGSFRPNDTITLDECIKTLVVVMGYEKSAQQLGGYPNGYYSVAVDKRLLTQVKGARKEAAIREDILLLIYNALDVPNMISNNLGTWELDNDTTIRSNIEKAKDIKSVTGVVTANSDMWLDKEQAAMKVDQIEINGVLYDVEEKVVAIASDLIGQEVIAYYKDDDDKGKNTIYNIQPTSHNTVTEIRAEDIEKFTNSEIKYTQDENKSTKIKLESDTRYTYNNRSEARFLDTFADIEDGFVIVIDNDGDDKIDFVFVNEYKSYLIEKPNKNGNLKLKYMDYEAGEPTVKYNNVLLNINDENTFVIKDVDGKQIAYDDLKSNDVLTIFENHQDTFLKIIKSDVEALSGTISGKSADNEVKIGDSYYEVEWDALYEWLNTGETYTFYLNAFGKIVYAVSGDSAQTEASVWKYGYIYQAYENDNGEQEVRIINAGAVRNREDTNLEDRTDTTTVPVTICQNDSVVLLKVAEKFSADNGFYESSDISRFKGIPVQYTVNQAGELKKIQTLNLVGGSETTIYNSTEKVFGTANVVYGTPFMIDEKTKVICVPDDNSTNINDLLVRLSIDNKDESIRYNALGYDLDEDTKAVKVFVLTKEMKADSVSAVVPKQAKLGVVQQVYDSMNDDDEECKFVTMMVGTELKKTETLALDGRPELEKLKRGDVIFYADDADGKIENVSIVNNVNAVLRGEQGTDNSSVSQIMGYVQDVSLNEINNTDRIRVNRLEVVTVDGPETIDVPISNYPDVFIYNINANTVESGTIDDIVSYPYQVDDAEQILIVKSGTTIRGIVIIR